jgi:hypothetical protein
MRIALLPFIVLFLPCTPANAQITAGEVPPGQFAYNTSVDLGLTTIFTADSSGLELDCDDAIDGWALLLRGYPAVDAPNIAELDFYMNEIEVCMDMASGSQHRPKYHTFGELMDCSGDYAWQNVDEVFLGDFGGFTAIGPVMVDSLYIAYRQNGIPGWMLLSFDLTDDDEIDLQVHSVLSVCGGSTSVLQLEAPSPVTLFPNPSSGEAINVKRADALRSIEVLDATGRTIAQCSGTVRTFAAPEVTGTYLIRFSHADGRLTTSRLVRY